MAEGAQGHRGWRLLGLTLSIGLGAFVAYFMLYVSPREGEIDRRNVRALEAMANTVASELSELDELIGNLALQLRPELIRSSASPACAVAAAAPAPQEGPAPRPEIPSWLDLTRVEPAAAGSQCAPTRVIATVNDLGGDADLQLRYRGCPKASRCPLHVEARARLERLLPRCADGLGHLDQVLIVDGQGRILYQDSPGGTRLRQLPKSKEPGEAGDAADKWSVPSMGPNRASVAVGTRRFLVYEQPLSLRLGVDGEPRADGTQGEFLEWRLVGLVDVDHFATERFALPFGPLLAIVFLLLFLLLSWPLLKLVLIGPRERLRAVDAQLLFFGMVGGVGVLTIACHDIAYLNGEGERRKERLEQLAARIERSLRAELLATHALLLRFGQRLERPERAVRQVDLRPPELFATQNPKLGLFQSLFLVNADGMQSSKWTPFDHATSMLDAHDRPYVEDTRRGHFNVRLPAGSSHSIEFNLHALRSRNTAQKLSVLSIPLPAFADERPPALTNVQPAAASPASPTGQDRPDRPARRENFTLHVATELVSLSAPLLPRGYGFAVIDGEGQVQYHSEPRRSLEENFFTACDDDRDLRVAVTNHAPGTLEVSYTGTRTLLRLQPLDFMPWTLIAYEESRVHDTINLEIVVTSLASFGLYIAVLALLRLLLFVCTGSTRSEWMWPEVRSTAGPSARTRSDRAPAESTAAIPGVAHAPSTDEPAAGGGKGPSLRARATVLLRALTSPSGKSTEQRRTAQIQVAILLTGQLMAFVAMLALGGRQGAFWTSIALPLCALSTAYLLLEPSGAQRLAYRLASCTLLGSSCVLAYAFFCASLPGASVASAALAIAILAATLTLVFTFGLLRSRAAGRREPLPAEEQRISAAYYVSGAWLLAILAACPAWAIFKDAAQVAQAARVEMAQREFTIDLAQRAEALSERYQPILGQDVLPTFVRSYLQGFAADEPAAQSEAGRLRWRNSHPLFDAEIPAAGPVPVQQADCEWFSARHFTCPLWRRLPIGHGNVTAALRPVSTPVGARFGKAPSGRPRPYLAPARLGVLGEQLVSVTARDDAQAFAGLGPLAAALIALVLGLCVGGLSVVTAHKLFGADVVSFPQPTPERASANLRRTWLGPPRDESSAPKPAPSAAQVLWLHFSPLRDDRKEIEARAGAHRIDLRDIDAFRFQVFPDGPLWVEYLEFNFGDPERTRRVLRLLEQWVYSEGRSLQVSIPIDPLHYLTECREDKRAAGEKADDWPEVERWAALLARFDRQHYGRPRLHLLHAGTDPAFVEPLRLLERECGWDEALHPIGERIATHPGLTALSEDELRLLVANCVGPRHRQLWALCTQEERLLMSRLAVEGYVNPREWAAARRLVRRGLLRRDPAYRLASDSFRAFAAHAMRPDELERLERAQRSTWMNLSLPLLGVLIAISAFVFWSQPALTNTLFAVLGFSSAGIAGLIRLVAAVRQSRAQFGDFRP